MTNNAIINAYAKAKITIEECNKTLKELESQVYNIITEEGEQTNGAKTYKVDTEAYSVSITESKATETVDYKAIAMALLGASTEADLKEYAKANGYMAERKGSIRYKAIKL